MRDETLSIREMYLYQQRLQEKYARQWGEPIAPDTAVRKLLWAHGELAEAGDILKKNGPIEEMLTHPEKKPGRHDVHVRRDAVLRHYAGGIFGNLQSEMRAEQKPLVRKERQHAEIQLGYARERRDS